MRASKLMCVLLVLSSAISFKTHATNTCKIEDYAIVFFNGVLTDRQEAEDNILATESALGHGAQYNQAKLRYVLAYNQSGKANGFVTALEDFAETFEQRSAEYDQILSERWELFWPILRGEQSSGFFDYQGDVLSGYFKLLQAALSEQRHDVITTLLTFLYNNQADIQTSKEHEAILDALVWHGSKIVLVAHSQGNLYMNQAYNHTKNVNAYSTGDAIKAVHIAPASPILNGNHVLLDVDYVITSLDLFTGWNINVNSFWPAGFDRPDPVGHNYIDMYLNGPSGARSTVVAAIDSELLSVSDPDLKEYLIELKLTPKHNVQSYYGATVQVTDYKSQLYTGGYDNYDPNNPPSYQILKEDGAGPNQDLSPTAINSDPYNGYRIENCGDYNEPDWLKHGSYMLTTEHPRTASSLNLDGAPQPGFDVELTTRFGDKITLQHNLFPGSIGQVISRLACDGMGLRHVVTLDQDDYKPFISIFRQETLQIPSKLKVEETWPLCVPH
ncbi:hypothetical protein [Grimontia sp. NTOU-MAR1]|uniref:hypothetical protein n=1 Tax=Grimontia sp. NTOU-MAR1 TaxID=3111011 RepID=UPI002DB6A247|nr:hypothetical protein [Grimontia sp. NTOU-MAR1]WRV98029.1 hypothetical protein VP504_00925 [Grimontia sp. NTOU-MAR1]